MLRALVLHLHPKIVPAKTLRFSLTFGLGGMALVLVLVLLATGVLLLFAYEPSVEGAYESVAALRYDVPMGQFFRNVHRWAANLALILVVVHMLRVAFTGALHGGRRGNWMVGLALLALVALSNFTGYLLPWDQVSYWAVTISTGMLEYIPGVGRFLQRAIRGGDDVGRRTLSTFFVLHVVFVPVVLVTLLAVHFWLVRKARGVVIPRARADDPIERDPMVATSPHLTHREGAVALALLAVLAVLALLVDAPLAASANPGLSPNPAKAPWYFMGFQELLIHFHPLFAVVVFPVLGLALLVRAARRESSAAEGVWFASPNGRRIATAAAVAGAVLTILGVLFDELVPDVANAFPGAPKLVTAGLVPFAATACIGWGALHVLRRKYSASPEESANAAFALGFSAFAALTLVGAAFRGAGMALTWPW